MRKVPSPIKPGFSVMEVVLAGSIFLMLVTGLLGAYLYGQEATLLAGNRLRASLLAEEGIEAARNIRDSGFANLTDGTHGLTLSGNQWNFSGSSDVNGLFTRTVTVAAAGTDRKSVTSNVTWQQNAQRTGSVSIVTQLTYWMEVTGGSWSSPFETTDLNLPGNVDGLRAQSVGNYLYIITDNATPDFEVFDITDPSSPVSVGSLSFSGIPRDIYVSGNYAYVTSDDNSAELHIIDISVPSSPTIVGTFNDAGTEDAQGIFVSGSRAYVTFNGGTEFAVVNVATPTAPTLLGTLNLNGFPRDVVVIGNYAYLANDDNSQELQVVNVTNPASPSLMASLNLTGNDNALAIAGAGTTIVVGRAGGQAHVISVVTPGAPSLQSTFDAGGVINDMAMHSNGTLVFLATDTNSAEFQILDISTPSAVFRLGFLDIEHDLNGVAYNAAQNMAYALGADNSEELHVIQPN